MRPDDVYVVYHGNDEEIISVHATKELAIVQRREYVRTELEKLRQERYLNSEDQSRIMMKYLITDLQDAVRWIYSNGEERGRNDAEKWMH